jgi:hypothetical protein
MTRDERGQVALSAIVLVMLLLVLAGVLVDALHLAAVRHRAYQVAADAALQGTRAGVDYGAYVAGGAVRLDETTARDRALSVVAQEAPMWGMDDYTVQVAVLPGPGEGAIAGFPSHPNAQQVGGTTWTADSPAVGVYLEAAVRTFFLGWFNGNAPIPVHAFAAAQVEEE